MFCCLRSALVWQNWCNSTSLCFFLTFSSHSLLTETVFGAVCLVCLLPGPSALLSPCDTVMSLPATESPKTSWSYSKHADCTNRLCPGASADTLGLDHSFHNGSMQTVSAERNSSNPFLCFTSLSSFRMYPIKEVPLETEALTDWLYQRFVEKEELLTHFYNTGLSHRATLAKLNWNIINWNASSCTYIFPKRLKPLCRHCEIGSYGCWLDQISV